MYTDEGDDNDVVSSQERLYTEEDEHEDVEKVSKFGAVFIVCNAALGAGLLNFPHAYAQAGGWPICLGLQILVMTLATIGLHFLAKGCRQYSVKTYQDIVHFMSGNIAGLISMVLIILYTYGCCITFLIVLGDQLEAIFDAILPDQPTEWYVNRMFLISILSFVFIFPLCFPRNIGFLKHAALLGFSSCLFVVFVVVFRYFVPQDGHVPPDNIPQYPQSFSGILSALPSLLFAYQCHVSSVPVYATMQDKSTNSWLTVVIISLVLCCVVYTATGTFGYLTFGLLVNNDILVSYGAKDPLVITARLLMAVAMITSYPILHFCGRAAILSITGLDQYDDGITIEQKNKLEKVRRMSLTCAWFFTSLLLAVLIPNITLVISVIGSFAAFFILIFPGLVIVQIVIDRVQWQKRSKNILQIIIGVLFTAFGAWIFGMTFTEAIMHDVSGIH